MSVATYVKLRGKEVRNPVVKYPLLAAAAIVTILLAVAGFIGWAFVALLAIVLSPLWVTLDVILKHRGRRGFIVKKADLVTLDFTPSSFRKVS